ncbi:Flagellar biosynthesis protein FlhB [hydrothermal vent metagenome]|uniref:Flagellar biosynthetic protein FlhB n=1 Tax=hydrothermal vent metagenome TaxID=652676 RepID=A0A3B0XWY1_9ZZZZ
MSESQTGGQEKTEEPTAKKREDSKKEGQVPRSKELNTSIVLMAAALSLLSMSKTMGDGIASILKSGLQIKRTQIFDRPETLVTSLADSMVAMFSLFIPYMLLLVVVVLLTPIMIGGWSFSMKAVKPKWSKISPMKGFKRMFSVKGLMELVKSILKVSLIGGVAALFIWNWSADLLSLGALPPSLAIYSGMELVGAIFLLLSVATLLIAAIDVPFQIFQHTKQLKMSKQEVRDEQKQAEGDPELKARVRRVQQDMAMSRMIEEIPKADVVVTNPTHYSIAIKYEEERGGAPIIVAKGADLIALKIRDIADRHEVLIFEAAPLARALYYSTKINEEIPSGLFQAIAQVLAYVYQLKVATDPETTPEMPQNIEMPPEYVDLANKKR